MTANLGIGSEFAGHRIEAVAARGGMGVIYRATQLRLGRTVALKLVPEELAQDPMRRERFKRESRIAASIDHPNVIPLYEAGEEGDVLFISMRWVDGSDLRALIDQSGPLDPARATGLITQIASALDAAHARYLIHRDIKPANILIADQDHVYLTDFGLSKHAASHDGLTRSGHWVGTVDYAAPEQIQGLALGPETDVYSLGCVIYEMLTGTVPFPQETDLAKLWAHVNAEPPSLSSIRRELPPGYDEIVQRAMAKTRPERYASAGELAEALAAIEKGAPMPANATSTPETGETSAGRTASGEVDALRRAPGDCLPLPAVLDTAKRSPFVGRTQHLERLHDHWQDARGGMHQLVLLEGEPGIGKTRLAWEFCLLAHDEGATVLYGRSDEDALVPYQSFVEALGHWLANCPPQRLRARVAPRAELSRLLPQLTQRVPDLPEPRTSDSESERFLLFEAVSSLLSEESAIAPIVLVLDDLHWADKSTLELLRHLTRSPHESRLLIVGPYREAELSRSDHLSRTIADLHREHHFERLSIKGLDEQGVGALISARVGAQAWPELTRTIHEETEGNPFFIEELLRHLAESGAIYQKEGRWASNLSIEQIGIPEGLKEVIGQRLARLPSTTSRTLSLASVSGRDFSLDVLEQLSDLPEEELLESLDEALDAQLIGEVPGRVGRYSFSHALIHETLYEEQTTTRRARLHRQIGEVMEELSGQGRERPLHELAHHFLKSAEAGWDVEKAIDYAVGAAESATDHLAHKEAATYYRRALETMEANQPQNDRRRCELLLDLGQAEWRAGDFDEAKKAFRRAAELAEALGAADQLALAAIGFGGPFASFEAGTVDEALVDLLEKALDGLGEGDSPLRARATSRLAEALTFSGDRERGAELSRQAVEMARRLDDPPTLAYVLERDHWATWGPENLEQRLAVATEIVQLVEEAGDVATELQIRVWRSSHFLESGEIQAADAEFEACRQLASQLRQPYNLWQVATIDAMLALLEGRFSEVEELAQRALAIGQEAENRNAVALCAAQILALRREQGRLHELEAGMSAFVEQYSGIPGWHTALAWVHSELGHQEQARREFEQMATDDFSALPRDMFWLKSTALLAEVCAYLGDDRRAAVLRESLSPYARRCIVDVPVAACSGSVAHFLGLLATTQGRFEEAVAHFELALEMNVKIRARPWVAHTQLQYARMLLTRREVHDGAKALELLDLALVTGQELGMQSLTERAQEASRQAQSLASG